MKKLHSLRRVASGKPRISPDSVKAAKETTRDDRARALLILQQAQWYYDAMERFRRERERCKRYTYGDQWSDRVCVDGEIMTEAEYLRRQGNAPMTNNLIRRLVRNVIGAYRNQAKEPTCVTRDRDEQQLGEVMSTVLQYNMQVNRMQDLYARSLEEFLISGFVVHRKSYGWRDGRQDCWTENIQPNNFFIDTSMKDPRGWDCSFVGEIHDVPFRELCSQFADSPVEHTRLTEIYRWARNPLMLRQTWEEFGYARPQAETDFLTPKDDSLCRVIEIWRKESKPRYRCHDWNTGEIFRIEPEDYPAVVLAENYRRQQMGQAAGMDPGEIPLIEATWFVDSYWYYYFITPMGDILREGESQYDHHSHPYVFKAYPFIDGEIHSFVSDVIDQQRYTNRLITLYDWIMRASAKGVLLIPEDSLPAGVSPRDFADTWTRFDGVLMYKPSKSGQVPHQVANNSTNIGISELLNLQLKLFEDISGIQGALQGKAGFSGMSAALYSLQTQNATTSITDILDTFSEFVRDAAYKDVSNIQQYYDDKKYYNIVGEEYLDIPDLPGRIRDTEFDYSVVQSQQTPVYRAITNEFLLQIFQAGQITLEQLLEAGNFPFADKLLQSVRAMKQQMQEAQAAGQQMQQDPAQVQQPEPATPQPAA